MKKFEIGRSYKNPFTGNVITITKRTAQFIFYTLTENGVDFYHGLVTRSKIRANNDGDEYITTPAKYMYFAKDEVSDEPEATETETPVSEPETPANDEPETADDTKAVAMTAQEATARKMIHEQSTEYLLKTWESTTTNNDPFIPTVRGWLMDELQSRYPEAYDKWLDSETCEDAALREYINAAIQAEQAATEGRHATAQDLNALISTAMYGWCNSLNAYCAAAGYYEDAQGEAAYQEAREAFAELRRMGYTDVQISALYAMRPQDGFSQPDATPEPVSGDEPAPEGAETEPVGRVKNPVAPYDLLHFHADSGTFLFENEGEAALIDALHFHADSGNALSVVNALYEITHDGGGWFSPRNHPVMLDALNDYISFLTDEIEIYDNFPNEMEKEIAVGKRAEAIAIRNAFAISADAAARATEAETAKGGLEAFAKMKTALEVKTDACA